MSDKKSNSFQETINQKPWIITIIVVIIVLVLSGIALGLYFGGVFDSSQQSITISSSSPRNSSSTNSSSPTICFSQGIDRSIFAVAGNPTRPNGFSGDGGPALDAAISPTGGIAYDPNGCIIYFFSSPARIRAINTSTGIIETVIGTGTAGSTIVENDPLATQIGSSVPDLFVDPSDSSLYICDRINLRVLRYTRAPTPTIERWAGTGLFTPRSQGQRQNISLHGPVSICKDNQGFFYIGDWGAPDIIYRVDGSTGQTIYFIGSPNVLTTPLTSSPQPLNLVTLFDIEYVRYDLDTNTLFWLDSIGETTLVVAQCSFFLNSAFIFFDTRFSSPPLLEPEGLVIRPFSTQLWISQPSQIVSINKINPNNISTPLIGTTGQFSNTGDGQLINSQTFINGPTVGVFDSLQNFFVIALSSNSMIRRITTRGL